MQQTLCNFSRGFFLWRRWYMEFDATKCLNVLGIDALFLAGCLGCAAGHFAHTFGQLCFRFRAKLCYVAENGLRLQIHRFADIYEGVGLRGSEEIEFMYFIWL